MAVWNSYGNVKIHKGPEFNIAGTIDFGAGTYNVSFYKEYYASGFGLTMYVEVWKGFPGDEGAKRCARLLKYDGYSNGMGKPTYSTSVSGSFTAQNSGSFYLVIICESHPSHSTSPASNPYQCYNVIGSWASNTFGKRLDWSKDDPYGGFQGLTTKYGSSDIDNKNLDYSMRNGGSGANQGVYISGLSLFQGAQAGEIRTDTPNPTGKTVRFNPWFNPPTNTYYAKLKEDGTPDTSTKSQLRTWIMVGSEKDTASQVPKEENVKYVKPYGTNTEATAEFTGLENNWGYTCYAECYEELDGKYNLVRASAYVVTYRTAVSIVKHTDATVTATAQVNKGYTGDIEWWYTVGSGGEDSTTTESNHAILATTNGAPVTIEVGGLEKGTEVTIYARPYGMADATGSSSDTTWTPTELDGMECVVTGTTITMIPKFSLGEEGEVEWRARLGGVIVSGNGNNPAKFNLLDNAVTYTVVFKGLQPVTEYVDPNVYYGPVFDTSELFESQDVYYDVRTYGCKLYERDCGTNSFTATVYQIFGAFGEFDKLLMEFKPYGYSGYCTRRDGNVPNGAYVGSVFIDETDQSVTVEGLEPNTSYRLYVWLKDCRDFEGYEDAVGYIDFTTKPMLVPGQFKARVTGRTVTVTPVISRWNGSTSFTYKCNISNNNIVESYGPNIECTMTSIQDCVITGLANGVKYRIDITAYDNNNNEFEVNSIEIVTYGISFMDYGESYTRGIDGIEIAYVDGEKSSRVSQDPTRGSYVRWWIESIADGSISEGPEYVNCRRTNPAKFNDNNRLIPNNGYIMYAEVEGVEFEGMNDTRISFEFDTKQCAQNYHIETRSTGETIGIQPFYTDATSKDNEVLCTFVLLLEGRTIATESVLDKRDIVWFTGLKRGTTYDIAFTAEDNEGNTTSDFIGYRMSGDDSYRTDESGDWVLKYGYAGLDSDSTYILTLDYFDYSTRSMEFIINSNKVIPPNKFIEYYIDQGEDDIKVNWKIRDPDSNNKMNSGDTRTYTTLKHKTETVLRARIYEMRDRMGVFDTEEEAYFTTKELTVNITGCTPHVDHVFIHTQAYADGEAYDQCQISGQVIRFVKDLCTIEPAIEGKGTVGGNNGTYFDGAQHSRRFDGLIGGREYIFQIGVTDGVNIDNVFINTATDTRNFSTLVELIRIFHDGAYHTALPIVYHNGEYYRAPMFVYGTAKGIRKWWHTNPERDYPNSD